MKEQMRSFLNKNILKVGQKTTEVFASSLEKEYGIDAFSHFPERIFKLRNIKPEFTGDLKDREKLKNQGGVIFSNHPGGAADIGIILETLKDESGKVRDDIKILIDPRYYDSYSSHLGQKHFVPASRNASEAMEIFNSTAEFVNNGGIFVIFPRNKLIEEKEGRLEFENGLAYLLAKLKPETMAYTFAINPKDMSSGFIGNLHKRVAQASMAVESSIGQNIRLPRIGKQRKVRVDERYSTCKEWQEVMASGKMRQDKSRLLREYYELIHKNNL